MDSDGHSVSGRAGSSRASGSEERTCQSCKTEFVIEPEDFDFYKKVSVPPPTWCPECRTIRRMTWRNERSLYKRKCDAPGHGEEIVSVFSPESPFTVYDQKYWWGDKWDPASYGMEYDFSKPFFVQFRELLEQMPLLAVFNGNAVNAEYANHALDSKNCYLITAAYQNENVMYSNRTVRNRDCVDIYLADQNELCYDNVNTGKCSRVFFSFGCEECTDCALMYDCRNCTDCFGCVGLRNKSYHIFNQPYSKEEYRKEIQKFDLGSYSALRKLKERHRQLVLKHPRKYMYSFKTQDAVGDIIGESRNAYNCFDSVQMDNCKHTIWCGAKSTDLYDTYGAGYGELLYEVIDSGLGVSQRFTVVLWGGHDVHYCFNCHSSDNLFGCVSLRGQKYCILNKQYSKKEYEELVPKIRKHMEDMPYVDKGGRVYKYGEFFPPELSPFAYNETIAQEYFPLSQEEAAAKGCLWKNEEARHYEATREPSELPDHIKDADESILKEVIACEHEGTCREQCTGAYRIVPEELKFYKRMNLPLPRLCPNCRHYQRLRQRNPLKLWHRQCMCDYKVFANTVSHPHHAEGRCPNEFETSYAPDRPEIVYCEQCYNAEIA